MTNAAPSSPGAKSKCALPVSRRFSQLAISCRISASMSTGWKSPRSIAASARAASLTSLIRRSSRATSFARQRKQLLLQRRVGDSFGAVERRAERGQRVLELVSYVGSESLDIVDPSPKRLAHVRNGARKLADLVPARWQARNSHFAGPPQPDSVRGDGKVAKWAHDRPHHEA